MMRATLGRYLPLVAHVVPTLAIGFGWVIPRSCIAGWNALTVGFGLSVASTAVAYVLGQRVAISCARSGSCRVAKT
jgi:ABC-type Fe3+ transport system permease subunit